MIGARMWMPVIRTTPPFLLNQVPPGWCPLPVYTVYSVKNVTYSEKDHGTTVTVMANTVGPDDRDFNLPIKVVIKTMHKISGRTWGPLGFSDPLCGQEISSPQLHVWVGKNKNVTTQTVDFPTFELTTPRFMGTESWKILQTHL